MQFYSMADFLFGPIALLIIIFLARVYAKRKMENNPMFKYFLPGLSIKLFGAFGLCIVYTLYYGGGDTIQYYHDGVCLVKLLFYNPPAFYRIITHAHDPSNIEFFSTDTGYPTYIRDKETWFVVKLSFIFVLFGFGSIIATNFLVATFSFMGVWRLFKVFNNEFPEIQKQLALTIFFIPSVFFWGSGLLKDSFTFAGTGYFVYGYYMAFIKKEKILGNLIVAILAALVILSIKPYIFVGLMPGTIFWSVHKIISQIKGKIAKIATIPLFLLLGAVFGYILLTLLQDQLSAYSIEKILMKSVVTQQDLKMEYYHGNSFNIGDFEPTIPSMLQKFPQALSATLFRPFLLEANNIVMFLSSIENLLILIFTIRVLIMVRVFGIFRFFLRHHLLTFCLIFSIFFGFAVGISTSNFGSLVRYKIPCIPFFVASLFIIQHLKQKEIDEEKRKTHEELNPKELLKIQEKLSS